MELAPDAFQCPADAKFVPLCANLAGEVELLHNAWDWQLHLDKLGVNVQGLAITETDGPANHAFRLVRRKDLGRFGCTNVQVALVFLQGRQGQVHRRR